MFHGDQPVMQGHWGAAVSANPFLGVRLRANLATPFESSGPIIRVAAARARPRSADCGCEGGSCEKTSSGFTLFAAWLCAVPLAADDGVFDQYRDLMGDDRYRRGEELWFTPQGPESVTLEACDLGLGPGSPRARTCASRATLTIPTR